MPLRRFLFTLICLLQASFCLAQHSMECGPVLKYKGIYAEEKVIAITPQNYYTLRIRPAPFTQDRHTLLKYNSLMELLWERKLPVTGGAYSDRILENVLYLKGRMLAFTSGKEYGLQCAWVQEVSTEGKLLEEPVKIDEMPAATYSSAGGFYFTFSADSANILVYHREPRKAKDPLQVSFSLLDTTLGIVWKKSFSYEAILETGILQYIAEENALYVLSSFTMTENNVEGRRYQLQHYNAELKEDHAYRIYPEDSTIRNRIMELRMRRGRTKGELLIGGIYCRKKEITPRGTILIRLDAEVNRIVTEEHDDFTDTFVKELTGEDEQLFIRGPAVYENISRLYQYHITDLFPDDEGNITLVFEKFCEHTTIRTSAQTSPGNLVNEFHFFYNDIVMVHRDAGGDLLWTCRIPKSQHTINDGGLYSSFVLIPFEGYFKLLYNDNPRNMDTGYSYSMMSPQEANIVMLNVDQEGNHSKQQLFPAKEMKTIFIPRASIYAGNEKYMLYWQHKNRFRYCSLRFRN